MKEIYRSNNPVEISYIKHSLAEHGIKAIELDQYASAVEGSISAIQRRIMVVEKDLHMATRILKELDL